MSKLATIITEAAATLPQWERGELWGEFWAIIQQGRVADPELAAVINGLVDAPEEAVERLHLAQSQIRDDVGLATLHLAAALEPDGQYDPADDPRPGQAVETLGALLGSTAAAEGIATALRELWLRKQYDQMKPQS